MAQAQDRFIVTASTSSTEQSGLFAHLLPAFKAASGIDVRVVAVGTGQALDTGRRADADIVFVHDTAAEEKFVAEGWSTQRRNVMYNDFVLVGPATDPAKARGDKSGIHAAEWRLWMAAGISTPRADPPGDYAFQMFERIESGGQGPAGSAATLKARREAATLQVIDVPDSINVRATYGIATLRPSIVSAQAFASFVLGPDGQAILRRHGFSAP